MEESKARAIEPILSDDAVVTGEKNPRGIPSIVFVESIDEFVTTCSVDFQEIVGQLSQMHSKYKVWEGQLLQRQVNLQAKIPEIQKTLDMIKLLVEKTEAEETMDAHFNLSDNVYTKATITPENKVYLWLGANVMLEYSYEEAITLLTKNKDGAEGALVEVSEDLDFVRAQVINSQVTMSRLFNWDVRKRRRERAAASK